MGAITKKTKERPGQIKKSRLKALKKEVKDATSWEDVQLVVMKLIKALLKEAE